MTKTCRVVDIYQLFNSVVTLWHNNKEMELTPEALAYFGDKVVTNIIVGDGEVFLEVE